MEDFEVADAGARSFAETANFPETEVLWISRLLCRSNPISDALKVLGVGEVPSF